MNLKKKKKETKNKPAVQVALRFLRAGKFNWVIYAQFYFGCLIVHEEYKCTN